MAWWHERQRRSEMLHYDPLLIQISRFRCDNVEMLAFTTIITDRQQTEQPGSENCVVSKKGRLCNG